MLTNWLNYVSNLSIDWEEDFWNCNVDSCKISIFFSRCDFSSNGCSRKEYRKQNWGMDIMKIVKIVDKVVEIWLGGVESLLTLWRVKIILKTIVIRLGVWIVLIWISPIWYIWLVHIVKYRVGIIRIKWGWCEIWIHVRIEKIVVVEFHFTNNHKKKENKQTNKQTKKKKTSLC